MSEILLAHAGPNGAGAIVFLPFLPVAAGLLFLVIAFRDKVDRTRDRSVRSLPNPKEHPLRDVHLALRSTRPTPTSPSRERKGRRMGPRHLRQL
jgi:hypothetical protein